MIWADALYLKSVPAVREAVTSLDPSLKKGKLLKALSVCLLYGYYDYALELTRAAGDVLGADDQATVERRLRESGHHRRASLPGRRHLAAALRRLWKLARPQDDSWSVSKAALGNQERVWG